MSRYRSLGQIHSVTQNDDGTLAYSWKPNRRGRRFAERWNRRVDREYWLIGEIARRLALSQLTLSNHHKSQEDAK